MLETLIEQLSTEWAIRALIASSLVGITCGILGTFIVLRNMSLIGDALSHAILPGIVVSFMLVGYSTIGFFFGSVLAGLVAAVTITWIQSEVKTKNDAAIGIVFTAMFSLGVIGISRLNKEPGVHLDLKDFLFGTVLSISNDDIILTAVIAVFTIFSIIVFYRPLFISTFQPTIAQTMGFSVKFIHYFLMLLLSFAVVSSLRTVGVILVVAMLITPASTALQLSNKLKNVIILSGLIGFLSAVIGFLFAVLLNTTPGPAMCVVATLFYGLSVLFAPEKGLLAREKIKRQEANKIIDEDILKYMFKNENKAALVSMSTDLELKEHRVKNRLKHLGKEGLVLGDNGHYVLSVKGKNLAMSQVRAHRLWETYLVEKMGLGEKQIHNAAERQEHVLTREDIAEVEQTLGYPANDPHGSPIPQAKKIDFPLIHLKLKQKAIIAKAQISDKVESELWELNLTPEKVIQLHSFGKESVKIMIGNHTIDIQSELAEMINVEPIKLN